VCSQVLVSLLISGVLGDEMEVLPADDESSVHLGGDDSTGEDTATDGNETGEWALLICAERVSMWLYDSLVPRATARIPPKVVSFPSSLFQLEIQAITSPPTPSQR
jgi:hypothetical protein